MARHDQAFSIRIPQALLHRLETRIAAHNSSPSKRGLHPLSISEAVRRMTEIGLDVSDHDNPESAQEWLLDHFGPTIANMIARAVADDGARALLNRIAARAEAHADPDFG